MKYLTKKWYQTMQKTDMHIPLKVSKKAETFSEEYYNELYKQEERQFIKWQKEILQAKSQFDQLLKDKIEILKHKLPTKILSKVADIRVLALNRASASIKEEITAYCMEQNILVQKALNHYCKYYDKEFKNCNNKFIKSSSLHDSLIIDIIKEQDRLTIKLDSSASFSVAKSIIFEGYTILEEEMNFINGWWLYEEIYKIDNQYELHILIDVPTNEQKSNLGYFTIRARDIILK